MTDQKRIPVFDFPLETREIGGLRCKVHRLPATRSPMVIARLIAEFGQVVAEYLCTTTPAALLKQAEGLGEATKANLLKLGGTAIKTVVASQAFVRIHESFKAGEFLDLNWYVHNLLPGHLELEGVRIDSMEELDATRIPPLILGQMVLFALESNFDPGFGGRDTGSGSSDHQELTQPEPEPESESEEDPPPTSSSDNAGKRKMTGRGARRRAGGSSGTSGGQSSKG